jgi:hypothetical protein
MATGLIFLLMVGTMFVFSALLIHLARLSERQRGVAREDGMVGEDVRWAEGREVVERRIVFVRGGLPPMPNGAGVRVKHERFKSTQPGLHVHA